jgi:pimeloyl-ACP methyl ester carboxylesterase
MGSELRENGKTIWGFKSLNWYFKHWKDDQLRPLQLTAQEREGEYGRVVPTALLSSPAFMPKFDKVNPYDKLVARLKANAVHQDAVTAFPYDWRLPVAYNGMLLVDAIEQHIHQWSRHPALKAYLNRYPGSRMKTVVVAHSMGGLVAQHAIANVRVDRIIALGTPWRGSAKTIGAMASGDLEGMPFSATAVTDLVTSMPSMYDLLPQWACVAPVDAAGDPTPIDAHVITSLKGDADLFNASKVDFHKRSGVVTETEFVSVAGVEQPTFASVEATRSGGFAVSARAFLRDGTGYARDTDKVLVTVDATGDGTVPHFSASLDQHAHRSVQRLQHNQLSFAAEGLTVASHYVSSTEKPQFLSGRSNLGVSVPQVVKLGNRSEIEVTGADGRSIIKVQVESHDGRVSTPSVVEGSDGRLRATAETRTEGIYTVRVGDGTGTPLETSYAVLSE